MACRPIIRSCSAKQGQQLDGANWHCWLAETLTLVLTIRDELPLEGLQAVVAALKQRCHAKAGPQRLPQAEALYLRHFASLA